MLGYSEAVRLLLDLYNIDATTILAKLPGHNKRLLHYVVVAKYNKNNKTFYNIIDPERQSNCERKNRDFKAYTENMSYIIPTPIFTNDVIGKNGLDMYAEDYFAHKEIPQITGTQNIDWLLNEKEKFEHQKNQNSTDIFKNQSRRNSNDLRENNGYER